jgi:hypothetical protein
VPHSRSRRRLLPALLAFVALACGDGGRASGASSGGIGPDAVLLRLPGAGGVASAHQAGSDSALWRSRDRIPSVSGVLGFDDFLGVVLAQDRGGRVVAVDLRLGSVETLGAERLEGEVVAEGSAVFSLDGQGRVLRLTPVATWNWPVPGGASGLIPNPDGSLLLLTSQRGSTLLRRVIPPETRVIDSATVPPVRLAARTAVGDRVWLVTDSGLVSLAMRDLSRAFALPLSDSVISLIPTPSGDRVFLATGRARLRVIDRYTESERTTIDLPAPAAALRMDPDGRYLLVRAEGADSVFVVSIGTSRVVNTLATPWRSDLPLVTPDGRILAVDGADVALVDAESGRERMRYRGGAGDVWALVRWNGFRPRAAGLDRPVQFEEYAADSAAADSALAALLAARYGDLSSIGRAAPLPPSPRQGQVNEPEPAFEPMRRDPSGRGTWTVSFATLLAEDRARSMADSIVVNGRRARVVTGTRDGIPVWRVLLGPFNSRQDAERAGMASRMSYWVFEGAP